MWNLFVRVAMFRDKILKLVRIMLETWNLVRKYTHNEKVTINENVSFTDHASGIRLSHFSKLVINLKNDNDISICWHVVIDNFFDPVLFLLSSLVTGPSFMTISSLVLELWQFSFIRDWAIGNTPVWVLPKSEVSYGYEIWHECL